MATNQERKAHQRQAILTAGVTCFTRDGYKATHIKDVADEAGVSQVTLYKYFDSKLSLGHQVVIEIINQGYADFQKLIDDQQLTFPEIIQTMMTNKVQMGAKIHPDFYKFVTDEMQSNLGSTAVREAYDIGEKTFWDSVVARGRAAGMINPDISNQALLIYLNMYVSYMSTADIEPATYKKLGEQLLHLFFYGFVGVPPTDASPTEPKQEGKS